MVVVSPSPLLHSEIPHGWAQHIALGLVDPYWVLFPHWRKLRLRRDLSSRCWADLGDKSTRLTSLNILLQSVLVSVVQGVLLPRLCVLGFSQWRLVFESLLVVRLVRGSEVRNNLCHHLGDITRADFRRKRGLQCRMLCATTEKRSRYFAGMKEGVLQARAFREGFIMILEE